MAIDALNEPIGLVVAGWGAHYYYMHSADGRGERDAMMRSHIQGVYRTLQSHCARHGCLAAVRDASAQHFRTPTVRDPSSPHLLSKPLGSHDLCMPP